jgi:dTDP-4-dehydrorhamnose 3,5-epimerase
VKVTATALPGVLLIEPSVYRDKRGFFLEAFHEQRFSEHHLPNEFRQDNWSHSTGGVLRGLHYQRTRPQGKLLTVMNGSIFDVAVDVRFGSPTFGRWAGFQLRGDEPRYLWIPPGFAHGFCVLSEQADILYKCTEYYDPADERGVRWDDPQLAIDWPIRDPILSPKDSGFAALSHSESDLPAYRPELNEQHI